MGAADRDSELAARERLEAVFRDHHQTVARYVRRRAAAAVVDDVVAETFLVAWRRLDAVPAEPLPWLLGVARRTLSTHARSARRQTALAQKLAAFADRPPGDAAGPHDTAVAEALARLRPHDREAITLIAWDELSPAQAAAALGQPRIAFRVRLHRARRRLREELEDEPGAQVTPRARPAVEEAEC